MTDTEKETENSFLLRFIRYHVTEQVNSSGLFSREKRTTPGFLSCPPSVIKDAEPEYINMKKLKDFNEVDRFLEERLLGYSKKELSSSTHNMSEGCRFLGVLTRLSYS